MLRRRVARVLGADAAVAGLLLARVRAHHGTRFAAYATLFLVVTARPFARVLPIDLRARFVHRFVEPMLSSAPAGLAYVTGRDAPLRDPCDGMLRS